MSNKFFPYSSMQELNLDWILTKIKNILRFVPDNGAAGQILRRTSIGAEWSDEQGDGAVSSVNGQTGDVVLDADDVGALPDTTAIPDSTSDLVNDSGFVNAAGAAAAAPVQSVNGMTGDVSVLPATDTQVTNAVNAWLGVNVAQETGYVLDSSLTMSNAAAPADAVGDIKDTVDTITQNGKNIFYGEWINGSKINGDGSISAGSVRNAITSLVPVSSGQEYTLSTYGAGLTFIALYVAYYRADASFISAPAPSSTHNITFTTPSDCTQVRFQTYQSVTTGTGLVPDETQLELGSTATQYEDPEKSLSVVQLRKALSAYQPTQKLENAITSIVNATLVAKSNENPYKDESILYSADSIIISTTGNAFSGLSFTLYGFQPGNVLTVYGKRSTGNDFFSRLQAFDQNNTQLSYSIGENGQPLNIIVPPDTDHITITFAACWGTALDPATQVTFENLRIYYQSVKSGAGSDLYTGKRIVLHDADDGEAQRCNIAEWKYYTSADYGSYNLQKSQGMAIYGGYLFNFKSDGGGVVIDFSSKAIISEFSTDPSSTHNNCAKFLNIRADEADEFPLIMLSRCLGSGADEAYIYRITRNGTAFTFTLVNTIVFNKSTHGLTWSYDDVNNKLVCCSLLNGDWQMTVNNPLAYWTFEMPSKTAILSGQLITLYESAVKTYSVFDYKVPQGMDIYGGYVFQAAQVGASKSPVITVLDLQHNETLSNIPLTLVYEPEDVVIFNGSMYVSQVDSTNTYGPLWISKIDF